MSQPPRAGAGAGAPLPGLLLPPALLASLSPAGDASQGTPPGAAAWNHLQILSELQVPNYYGRQPQAAHMSSERPLSHSPLTWHTPTPSPSERQPPKGGPVFGHTPPPPEVQLLKCAANPALFRHTPTPPDRDSLKSFRHTPTPPDVQALKGSGAPYRHTPTPPDVAHAIKGGVSAFRHTPPPDCPKGPSNPLFNLQQMIADGRGVPTREGYARLSPGPAPGSVDLSVTRSPRNGGQNGETVAPIGLSVRDASKINSLDSTEINVHRVPRAPFVGEAPIGDPASARRPARRVDSLLERLNSDPDGVAITPVGHPRSSLSVIVSAHAAEDDAGARNSSAPFPNPAINLPPHTTCEPVRSSPTRRPTPAEPSRPDVSISITEANPTADGPRRTETRSVIIEAIGPPRGEPPPADRSNDDSDGSLGDGVRSKRRRKPPKTSRIERSDPNGTSETGEPASEDDGATNKTGKALAETTTGGIAEVERPVNMAKSKFESQPTTDTTTMNGLETETGEIGERSTNRERMTSVNRRKTISETETIDNIAALIASNETAATAHDLMLKSQDFTDAPKSIENIKAVLESSSDFRESETLPEIAKTSNDASAEGAESIGESANDPVKSESCFGEVENELEKMFAGIEESKMRDGENANEVKSETVKEKKPGKRGRRKRVLTDDVGAEGNVDGVPPKKKRGRKPMNRVPMPNDNVEALQPKRRGKPPKAAKDIKKDVFKPDLPNHRDAYDSGSNASSSKSRGPYVQIKGPRDSPISVNVINTPQQDDDVDKSLQKIKAVKGKSSLNSDSDFRTKVKSKGLHSSTLSMKYDATTTDVSWICVFCKRGPHTGGLAKNRAEMENMGDLFGPYVVTTKCPDYKSMITDPLDCLFKKRIKPDQSSPVKQTKQAMRKQKLDSESAEADKSKLPSEEMYQGMTEAGEDSYEVWLHEMCALWAPGVYMVGAKMVGLENAVWSCCTIRCDRCSLFGATIACIKHGCSKTMHVNCARSSYWTLSDEDFMVYCAEHKLP